MAHQGTNSETAGGETGQSDVPKTGGIAKRPAKDAVLPAVPPEWVTLKLASRWIERIHGEGAAVTITQELLLSVRDGILREHHRIPRIEPRIGHQGTGQLPPGLDYKRGWMGSILNRTWIVANDWEAAKADWRFCTVGGWERNGRRERLPVEVLWKEIAWLASVRADALKRQAVKMMSAPPPKKHAGGAPEKYDWTVFAAEVVRVAETPDGLPEFGEMLRQMTEWAAREFGAEPSPNTVRTHLAKLYRHRQKPS